MLIREIELTNVKSYRHQRMEFLPGVNGIIGENGSGKSTIIEAIGYVLFGFLPYRNRDYFLRRGAKKGSVRLVVEGDDGATYELVRGVGSNSTYTLSCPREGIEVSGVHDVGYVIAERLLPAIPQGQLAPMFEQLIGVPQGSFFSTFLLRPALRKEQFNRILRVDEYDRAYENLRDVESDVREEISSLRQRAAELEALTREHPSLVEADRVLRHMLRESRAELEECRSWVDATRQWLEELEQVVDDIRSVRHEIELAMKEAEGTRGELEVVSREFEETKRARERIKQLEPQFLEHEKLQKEIERLEEAQRRMEKLMRMRERCGAVASQLAARLEGRERLEQRRRELEERCMQLETAPEQLSSLTAARESLMGLGLRRDELRRDIQRTEEQLSELDCLSRELEELKSSLLSLRELSEQEGELSEELARVRALAAQMDSEKRQLEERMRISGRGRECPILEHTECPMVESFERYFEEEIALRERRTEEARAKMEVLEERLAALGEPTRRAAQLEGEMEEKRRRLSLLSSLKEELSSKRRELAEVERAIWEAAHELGAPLFASDIASLMEHVEERLEKVRAEVDELRRCQMELSSVKGELSKMDELEARLHTANQRLSEIDRSLDEVRGVPEQLSQSKRRLSELEQPYREYIAEMERARMYEKLRIQRMELEMRLHSLLSRVDELQRTYESLVEHYSDEEHLDAYQSLVHMEERCAHLESAVELLDVRRAGVLKRLAHMEELLRDLSSVREQLEERESMHAFVQFVREALRRAAPLVIRRVVRDVSEEANGIFCEAMGSYTQQLIWSDDESSLYDIQLKEGGEVRSFRQLSGGEQMCASIAVRLALLKMLSDSDVVFLDEPTANLDEQRRENLSDEVLSITGFEQIFVITHDDSFSDKYDHTVHLRKVDGESVVEQLMRPLS